jgi:transcriptional regulator with XRE-family HTH domain
VPDQLALRRRLRAARTLQGVTLRELADRIDPVWKLSERSLRKLESGESEITERSLRPIGEALDVPYGWLVAEDPFAPWRMPDPVELERRLAGLERAVEALGV